MATGRIGVTPTLRTRWSKAPAGGTTSLSGLDDNSVSLVYDVGYEGVYRNGVLLSRGNDYTATDGTTVTLIDATITGDIIEIFANELIPLSDAISKGQYTAKGALLSATAASTPGVLTVGSNDQVLTADSSTATGLKWSTPATGALTLISATSFSASSAHNVNDVFSSTYDNYLIQIATTAMSANLYLAMRLRVGGSDNSSNNYGFSAMANGSGNSAFDGQFSNGLISSWYLLNGDGANHINGYIEMVLRSPNLTQRTGFNHRVAANSGTGSYQHHGGGMLSVDTSYTGFTLITTTGNVTGNVKVYGYAN